MVTLPDRLSDLIQQLEAGHAATDADIRTLCALQALDLARIGEQFARQTIERETEQTRRLEQGVE